MIPVASEEEEHGKVGSIQFDEDPNYAQNNHIEAWIHSHPRAQNLMASERDLTTHRAVEKMWGKPLLMVIVGLDEQNTLNVSCYKMDPTQTYVEVPVNAGSGVKQKSPQVEFESVNFHS